MLIYLIGYMGSGKTTVGNKLAKFMNYDFVDLDQLFEEKYRLSVYDFFQKYDENAFRKIEHALLLEISLRKNLVISTGGGAPCFYDNLEIMKNTGITVYLEMSVKSLADRLSKAKKVRPILKGLKEDELNTFIEDQLEKRKTFYQQAQLVFKGESISIETLAQKIDSLLPA